jgi:hypothetical protein
MENLSANQILQELQDINNKFTEMGFPISIHHEGDRYPIEGMDVYYNHDEQTRLINGIHSVDLNTGVQAKTISASKAINDAKEVLRQAGYYMDNLWHIEDVRMNYECTDKQAMNVLESVLTDEYIMEMINVSISSQAKELNLKQH